MIYTFLTVVAFVVGAWCNYYVYRLATDKPSEQEKMLSVLYDGGYMAFRGATARKYVGISVVCAIWIVVYFVEIL